MAGYNLPDDLLPNSPEAPWNKEEIEIVDAYRFREFHIPLRMMPSIELYINQGIQPGDFLTAVICNDLALAVGRADEENIENLPAYVHYFYNEAPGQCWGSREKKVAWTKKFERKCVICGGLTRVQCYTTRGKVFMCQECQEREG